LNGVEYLRFMELLPIPLIASVHELQPVWPHLAGEFEFRFPPARFAHWLCVRAASRAIPKNDENVAPRNYGRNRIVHAGDDLVTAGRQGTSLFRENLMLPKRQSSSSPSLVAYQRTPSLTGSGSLLTLLAEHGRREREIKKAVAALAKLDDRTLRDIGIPHRSQIEQLVRYCRDC
jgi:uncharacterized protein YjiS (DUF1127 family)